MKKSENKWLAIGAAFIMFGIIGFFYVMTAIGWNLSGLRKEKFELSTVEIKEDFRNISINTDTEDISFLPSADGKCRVGLYGHKKVKYDVSVQDGTLSISMTDTRKWYERISLFLGTPKITLYLPADEYASLFIRNDTGDIIIPESFTFESISISASTGDVDCYASSGGLVYIKTSTGHIHIENISAGELDLSVSTGNIEMSSVACEGNVNLAVSTGKTRLKDVSCKNIFSGGSTGNISLENVIAAEKVTINRSTGDVKFEYCDAGELDITTGTGDVTGSLLSGKTFIAKSHTGRIDIPETTTGGTCRITTDTGKIMISIK